MAYLFVEYPKCTTCQKAKKWLEENGVPYIDRHIVEQNPSRGTEGMANAQWFAIKALFQHQWFVV